MSNYKTISPHDTVTLSNGQVYDYHPQFHFHPQTCWRRWICKLEAFIESTSPWKLWAGHINHHLHVGECVYTKDTGLFFLVGRDQQLHLLGNQEEYRDYHNQRIDTQSRSQ